MSWQVWLAGSARRNAAALGSSSGTSTMSNQSQVAGGFGFIAEWADGLL
jgi:hypothetical protein